MKKAKKIKINLNNLIELLDNLIYWHTEKTKKRKKENAMDVKN